MPRWIFPSKIYIQFTLFNTYFLTKLLFLNKRYNTVWMGTTHLEDQKKPNEKRKGLTIESSQKLMFCFPLRMNKVLPQWKNLKVTARMKFRLYIILFIIYCLYYFWNLKARKEKVNYLIKFHSNILLCDCMQIWIQRMKFIKKCFIIFNHNLYLILFILKIIIHIIYLL